MAQCDLCKAVSMPIWAQACPSCGDMAHRWSTVQGRFLLDQVGHLLGVDSSGCLWTFLPSLAMMFLLFRPIITSSLMWAGLFGYWCDLSVYLSIYNILNCSVVGQAFWGWGISGVGWGRGSGSYMVSSLFSFSVITVAHQALGQVNFCCSVFETALAEWVFYKKVPLCGYIMWRAHLVASLVQPWWLHGGWNTADTYENFLMDLDVRKYLAWKICIKAATYLRVQ